MHDQRGVTCNDILGPDSFLSRLMRPLPLKNWNKTKIQRWLKKSPPYCLVRTVFATCTILQYKSLPRVILIYIGGTVRRTRHDTGKLSCTAFTPSTQKEFESAYKKKPAPFLQISALTYYLKHAGETWDGNCNRCGSSLSLVGLFLPTSPQGDLGTILLCPT